MEIIGDFKTTVRKSLSEIEPNFEQLPGLVICGTHAPTKEDAEAQILKLKEAREKQIPTLGICWGLQVMMIEFGRNVYKIKDVTSEELDPESPSVIVVKLPQLRVGVREVGGRLESHWHNYRIQEIDAMAQDFSMIHSEGIIELVRLKDHRFYVGVQYHPEYQSSKDTPHPLLVDFLKTCSAA